MIILKTLKIYGLHKYLTTINYNYFNYQTLKETLVWLQGNLIGMVKRLKLRIIRSQAPKLFYLKHGEGSTTKQ
jgi:hypothetical protein